MKSVIARSAVCLLGSSACSGIEDENDNQAQGRAILEVNVTNQPEYKNGQTAIAINPKNHDNLVYTATKHDLSQGLIGQNVWG